MLVKLFFVRVVFFFHHGAVNSRAFEISFDLVHRSEPLDSLLNGGMGTEEVHDHATGQGIAMAPIRISLCLIVTALASYMLKTTMSDYQ